MAGNTPRADILIVDDTPANLRVLSRLLSDNGYKVRPVPNGKLAIEAVKASEPDLIFLDIRMPDMDGYEVCEALKSSDTTCDIPIIFISALNDLEDKVKGFESGAVDFITKPFQEGEVLIRLETHLTIRNQRREIANQVVQLRQLETLRENLTQMIVHDLNNPLHGILGFIQLLRLELAELDNDKLVKYATSIESSVKSAVDMIRAILDVGKIESGEMKISREEIVLAASLKEIVAGIESLTRDKRLIVDVACGDDVPSLYVDPDLFRRIIVNIIGNAIKFSPDDGTIGIAASATPDSIRIEIKDEGPGIPPEFRATIFEKYGQVESRTSGRKYSTGLGLAFCKLAVETHGGTIGVISEEGSGSIFWMHFPTTRGES